MLGAWLRPGVAHASLLLHPVGRAAWVGLFATALNLLPAGQLDGGHILFALTSGRHRWISIAVAIALVPLGWFFWMGWFLWAVLLVVIGFRHPPLLDGWEPLDAARRILGGSGAGNLSSLLHARAFHRLTTLTIRFHRDPRPENGPIRNPFLPAKARH